MLLQCITRRAGGLVQKIVILCKSVVLVQKQMQVLHYKFLCQGKSALQILFLILRKFVMHLYEYDTFAVHNCCPKPINCTEYSRIEWKHV